MTRVARLGAEPGLAVEERRPVGNEIQGIPEFPAADLGPVAARALLETPVADPGAGLADGKADPPEANAGGAFVMAQAAKRLPRSSLAKSCACNPVLHFRLETALQFA